MKHTKKGLDMRRVPGLVGLLLLPVASVLAQEGWPGFVEDDRPPPRYEDGRINFGAPLGSSGYWSRRTQNIVVNPDNYQPVDTQIAPIHIDEVPLQEWALALTNYRAGPMNLASEPYARCKPAPGPRQIMSPYGFEIVDVPELQRIYILTTSNAMTWRVIYMDGREHPDDLLPSYFGHSVGHWEGDVLVVDTVGLNEKSWTTRDGLPTTEQAHLIERYSRPNYSNLIYEVTTDDPGAYDAPWTSGYVIGWNEGEELFEFICQENNLSIESMLGDGRFNNIAP